MVFELNVNKSEQVVTSCGSRVWKILRPHLISVGKRTAISSESGIQAGSERGVPLAMNSLFPTSVSCADSEKLNTVSAAGVIQGASMRWRNHRQH